MPLMWKDLSAARHSTVGLEIVLSILMGTGLGYLADRKFETAPILMVLGALYGVGAAIRAAHRAHKQSLKALENDNFDAASADRPAHFKRQAREEES